MVLVIVLEWNAHTLSLRSSLHQFNVSFSFTLSIYKYMQQKTYTHRNIFVSIASIEIAIFDCGIALLNSYLILMVARLLQIATTPLMQNKYQKKTYIHTHIHIKTAIWMMRIAYLYEIQIQTRTHWNWIQFCDVWCVFNFYPCLKW